MSDRLYVAATEAGYATACLHVMEVIDHANAEGLITHEVLMELYKRIANLQKGYKCPVP